ncbi:MAG: RluA family pseudouridine synthase [Defluviitaleaceae bacterium]|nr:RluA family pseudouridine synthase [Defluviitaleaceae bacterium]
MKKITITENDENGRLDKLLMRTLSEAAKSFIYKMLRKKNITLDGKKASGSEILKKGSEVSIFLSDETFDKFSKVKAVSEVAGELDVLYEDENIVVINKEAGILSQPDSSSAGDSVVERLVKYLRDKGEYDASDVSSFAPVVCNRLDRNTSGIMICAKNLASAREIAAGLKERSIEKYYITVVAGEINGSGVIKAYYIKDSENNEAFTYDKPVPGSKEIITEYESVKSTDKYSILKIKLVTGKSHQIRAVLAKMGNPILGDGKYGDYDLNGMLIRRFKLKYQLLHAESVIFGNFETKLSYLSGKRFECPLRDEFAVIIRAVGL